MQIENEIAGGETEVVETPEVTDAADETNDVSEDNAEQEAVEGEEPDVPTLRALLRKGTLSLSFVPVLGPTTMFIPL